MAFIGKDPKDTYLALLNMGNANDAIPAVTPAVVGDAAGNDSLLGLSQNAIEFIGVLMADVASGLVMDAGIAFEADAVSVDSVLNKSDNAVGVFFTSGDPEGSLTAGIGSLALRDDGAGGTTGYIKETGTGNTGWVALEITTTFLELTDVPNSFVATKFLQVDATGNFLEWVDTPVANDYFTDLIDTPADYTDQKGKFVSVNVGETFLEFVDGPSGTFLGLTDTPIAYVSGKWMKVNGAGNAVEFVDADFVPYGSPVQGEVLYYDGATWSALAVGIDNQVLTTHSTGVNPTWEDPGGFPTGGQGEILYHTGTAWVVMPVGTDEQVLTTHGLAANPTWETPAPGTTVFTGLTDTPSSYTNTGILTTSGDAVIESFATANQGELLYRNATDWVVLPVGAVDQVLATQGAGANLVWKNTTDLPSGGAQGDVTYYDGGAWKLLTVGTDGQFLKTQGAAANPVWTDAPVEFPSGTQGDVIFHNGAAWVVLGYGTAGQQLTTQGVSADPTWENASTLPVAVQGEIIYHTGSGWASLGVGTEGQVLSTHGAAQNPTWGGVSTTFAALTDTVMTTPAQGEVLYWDGTDWVNMAVGTSGQVLSTQGAAANPIWVDISTGLTFAALTDTVMTTPAQGEVLYFDGSDWVNMAVGTDGYLLTTHGAASNPTWTEIVTITTFADLDDTVMTTPAQGEVLYFDGSDWVNLGVGTDGYFLATHGAAADPTWAEPTFSGLTDTVMTTPAQGEILFFDGSDWVNLAVDTSGKVLSTQGAAADPIWVDAGTGVAFAGLTDTNITGVAQGDVLFWDGSDWVNLAPSTDGHVFTTHGAAANPTWAAAAGMSTSGGTFIGDVTWDNADIFMTNDGAPACNWQIYVDDTTGNWIIDDAEYTYRGIEIGIAPVGLYINTYGVGVGANPASGDGFLLDDTFMTVSNNYSIGWKVFAGTRRGMLNLSVGDVFQVGSRNDSVELLLQGTATRPSYYDQPGTTTEIALLTDTIGGLATPAQGEVVYYGASAWTKLAVGTSGYFLTSGGSAANVTWEQVAFTDASDTPSSYGSSDNDKIVKVNAGETAVEFGSRLMTGSGDPESSVVGSPGDIYVRTDGNVTDVLYAKATGSETNTGWAAVTSAA